MALSILKVQVSVLSVLFQKPVASQSLFKTLFQDVAQVIPPVQPWDLKLVLSVPQRPPFEPIRNITLEDPTYKVPFLMDITSVRCDSKSAALMKAEDIALPYLSPASNDANKNFLHCIDSVRAVRDYLPATVSICQTICPPFVSTKGTSCLWLHHCEVVQTTYF